MKDPQFKLALVRYVYDTLGYAVTEDNDSFDDIAEYFRGNQKVKSEGIEQTRWFKVGKTAFVDNDESKLSESKYRKIDNNIYNYLNSINENRASPLQLRYYQYLAVFFTEVVLDQYERGVLINRFNKFIDDEFWQFEEDVLHLSDFSKLAYWMATGSGKTHIMHINILQVCKYFNHEEFDNLILIAPNEQIANQHMEELDKNGISHESLKNSDGNFKTVKVTDINKLKRGESGPKTVDVEDFGQQNLIFVDEGHKGLGSLSSSSSGWIEKRDYLIGSSRQNNSMDRNGFAFEYSATFASSLNDAAGYQEYSRSIVMDYPYGRFHKDGYGKDYNILNISPDSQYSDIIQNERDKWLLSNLLSYYEKLRIFEDEKDLARDHNIERPLSVFVGNSVNAISRGSSDVQTIVEFLSDVIQNKNSWVTSVIDSILSKEDEFAEGGLFDDRFTYLIEHMDSADQLYDDLLNRLFDSKNPSELELVRLKNLEDEEIALTTDSTNTYFGVVTVGDTKEFCDLIENSDKNIKTIENEVHSSSLFDRIDAGDSSIDILIGSKKFAEGWDSTRPSTLGLLNLGRSEGPLVVQMFGRGVRVNGNEDDGKRADMKEVPQSKNYQVSRLETLDVFGIRAEYIETFKEHLEEERTEIDNIETVTVKVDKPTTESSLKVPEFQKETAEDEIPTVSLDNTIGEQNIAHLLQIDDSDEDKSYLGTPEVSIQTKGTKITNKEEQDYHSKLSSYDIEDFEFNIEGLEVRMDNSRHKLDVLDWDNIWQSVIQYKNNRGYDELVIEKSAVRRFFEVEDYRLYLPQDTMNIGSLDDISRMESICARLISNYMDIVYSEMTRSVEYEEVKLTSIDENWIEDNLPSSYDVRVKNPDENEELIEGLMSIDSDSLKEIGETETSDFKKELFKYLEQLYVPVLLDSEAFNDRGSEKKYKDIIHSISPEGIDNMGERRFVDALEYHINQGDLKQYETIVMRNQANNGVSIPGVLGEFYPDFVIWVTKDGVQHIILADPHGMVLGGDKYELDAIRSVNDEKTTDDDETEIHACIFARTDGNGSTFSKAKEKVASSNGLEVTELRDNYIYFVDELDSGMGQTKEEVSNMLEDFLE